MPSLNPSNLNTLLTILGLYIVVFGLFSSKIKNVWYLGEALPAIITGIALGPFAAGFIDSEKWGAAEPGQTSDITLGFTRVMIGIQLVIAGYQLPAKYTWHRCKDMAVMLLPVMTLMWLSTTLCIMAAVPKVSLLASMVIAACVTSTDPVLSQAVAKGPFSDKYVARPVREIISAEAGANDGFGFPFLMLATYLIRHSHHEVIPDPLQRRAGDVERQGGGTGEAIGNWVLYTLLYYVAMGALYGAVIGTLVRFAVKFASRKKWIDSESYLLVPVAFGLFFVGSPGLLGSNDLLACFAAGSALNWDGEYLAETLRLHDELNSSIDMLLNFTGFMYLGSIFPWDEFSSEATGLTYGRLVGLGFLVLVFRRIPAILLTYKLIPNSIRTWKEAVFVGYFGPIGIGAAFYVEHTRHVYPKLGETDDAEVNDLLRAIGPVVYWLSFFSIVVHGLSIPILSLAYRYMGIQPVQNDAIEMRRASVHVAAPSNAVEGDDGDTFIAYNRFSRPVMESGELPTYRERGASRGRRSWGSRASFELSPVQKEELKKNGLEGEGEEVEVERVEREERERERVQSPRKKHKRSSTRSTVRFSERSRNDWVAL